MGSPTWLNILCCGVRSRETSGASEDPEQDAESLLASAFSSVKWGDAIPLNSLLEIVGVGQQLDNVITPGLAVVIKAFTLFLFDR